MTDRTRARAARVAAVLAALPALAGGVAVAAPSAPQLVAPADGALIGVPEVLVEGTVDGSTVEVRVLEGTTVLASTGVGHGAFRIEVPGLADGPHTLRVRALDAGMNASPDTVVSITLDTTPPAPPVIAAPSPGDLIANTPVSIEGTSEPDATIRVRDVTTGSSFTGRAAASGAWLVEAALGDGGRTIEAVAIDAAGNESAPSPQRSFTVDTRAPVAPTILLPGEGTEHRTAALTVHGIAEPFSTVRIDEGLQLASLIANGNGTWQTTITFAEGNHAITVRSTDAAGHPSPPATRRFTIDLTPPAPPEILQPIEDALVGPINLTITGRAEAHSTVTVFRGGVEIATAITDKFGNWLALTPVAGGGVTEITARARDRAGNLGAHSPVRTFVVDAIAPTVDIITPNGRIFLPGQTPKIEGTATDDHGLARIELAFYDLIGQGIRSTVAICDKCPTGKSVYWRSSETPLIGRFIVKAYAVDLVGNRSEEAQIVVTIVRTP